MKGTAATDGTWIGVLFLVDGEPVSWASNGGAILAPGVSVTLIADGGPSGHPFWKTCAGSHAVVAQIDDVDRIIEINETNNTFSRVISIEDGVQRSDIIITSAGWNIENPPPGAPLTFWATVKNQGSTSTNNALIGVLFSIDGLPVSWTHNGGTALTSGASVKLVANGGPLGTAVWSAASGDHTLTANVDDVNRIPESDETNNHFTSKLAVSESSSLEGFLFEGSFDFSDRSSPVVIWQGSRIGLDFEGDTLSLRFDHISGDSYFDVSIDRKNSILQLRENFPPSGLDFSNLGGARHQLRLFKRSEASVGTAHFGGVQLALNAQSWKPSSTNHRLKMLFFGDSITVGACDEDGPKDQWDNHLTHNNALSYSALTANAFFADYRNRAVSGMGVSAGWVDVKANEIWDKLYPYRNSPFGDLAFWRPDLVIINLGENDDSFTRVYNQPFPSNFTDNYISFVRSIRSTWPQVRIILIRGGMYGGSQSLPLTEAWQRAVNVVEAADNKISHFIFQHWTASHPRIVDHEILAGELITWLRQQSFMQIY